MNSRQPGFSRFQLLLSALLGLVLILNLGSCASSATYRSVAVAELRSAQLSKAIILDVRQPEEYAAGHVAGARLLPLGELGARADEIPNDQPVFVICHSGNRSKQASELLASKGKLDIRNVLGGMIAWQQAGYPTEQ
jgi:phage shock protein E